MAFFSRGGGEGVSHALRSQKRGPRLPSPMILEVGEIHLAVSLGRVRLANKPKSGSNPSSIDYPQGVTGANWLGSRLIQTQNAMMAARTTADKKLRASLS